MLNRITHTFGIVKKKVVPKTNKWFFINKVLKYMFLLVIYQLKVVPKTVPKKIK